MKKRSSFCFHFFPLLLMTASVFFANGQQQYTQVASRENSYCNSTCTLINVSELNNNRIAVVIATPVMENGYVYPHPIGVHFINDKWSIINLDQQSMPPGSKFTVQYFSKPNSEHQFVHTVSIENLTNNHTRSFIDHAGLNNNPEAQFRFISNGSGNGNNMYDIRIQYDTTAGEWYICSIKKRPLDTNIAFNIIIGSKSAVTQIPTNIRKDVTLFDSAKATNIQTVPPVINKSDMPPVKQPKTIATTYDFSKIRICIDKGIGIGIQPGALPAAAPAIPTISSSGEIVPVSKTSQGLTGASGKMWPTGSIITVGFIGPGPESLIKKYAKEWETFANIKFSFIQDVYKAQVRVGFDKDGTFWSYLGWDANENPTSQASRPFHTTMNFGWKDTDQPTDMEIRSMALHEFGHALGFIHESNPPPGGIPWDQDKLNSFLGSNLNGGTPVVLEETNHFHSNSSTYDASSIMRYFYPATLTADGSSTTLNTDFSSKDKTMAGQFYPFPTGPQTQQGDLHTGDDCDDIFFTVEYNVVNKNVVEFDLVSVVNENNIVQTPAWKKISIPTIGNGEVGLEIQNGSSVTKSVAVVIIDKTKGIGFGKAKLLGYHTGLSFTWNVWPAIIGGCRVKFSWLKDKCQ